MTFVKLLLLICFEQRVLFAPFVSYPTFGCACRDFPADTDESKDWRKEARKKDPPVQLNDY